MSECKRGCEKERTGVELRNVFFSFKAQLKTQYINQVNALPDFELFAGCHD